MKPIVLGGFLLTFLLNTQAYAQVCSELFREVRFAGRLSGELVADYTESLEHSRPLSRHTPSERRAYKSILANMDQQLAHVMSAARPIRLAKIIKLRYRIWVASKQAESGFDYIDKNLAALTSNFFTLVSTENPTFTPDQFWTENRGFPYGAESLVVIDQQLTRPELIHLLPYPIFLVQLKPHADAIFNDLDILNSQADFFARHYSAYEQNRISLPDLRKYLLDRHQFNLKFLDFIDTISDSKQKQILQVLWLEIFRDGNSPTGDREFSAKTIREFLSLFKKTPPDKLTGWKLEVSIEQYLEVLRKSRYWLPLENKIVTETSFAQALANLELFLQSLT